MCFFLYYPMRNGGQEIGKIRVIMLYSWLLFESKYNLWQLSALEIDQRVKTRSRTETTWK